MLRIADENEFLAVTKEGKVECLLCSGQHTTIAEGPAAEFSHSGSTANGTTNSTKDREGTVA